MQPGHQNMKEFDKRTEIESKKVKSLAQAMEKMKKSIDNEKKAYCVELKKGIDQYGASPHFSPNLQKIIQEYSTGLEKLAPVYDRATTHIQDVSCNALGYLPKKYETYKKSIKVSDKMPEGVHKLKDYEYERIQYTRQAMLHYINAQMLIQAQQFQLYADLFDKLEQVNDADETAALYDNADWVVKDLKSKGFNMKLK
eukprot:403374149